MSTTFQKANGGKFLIKCKKNLPLYLDPEVLSYFAGDAKAKGVELNVLLNDLLKKDIALIEASNKTLLRCITLFHSAQVSDTAFIGRDS